MGGPEPWDSPAAKLAQMVSVRARPAFHLKSAPAVSGRMEIDMESVAPSAQFAPGRFIGTKVIKAWPMSRMDYNSLRGWTVPVDEDGRDPGYLVEYLDGGKPNCEDKGYAGYVSWSPKEQFENAYRPTSGLPFGLALEAMKVGKKVARVGWNGKAMWVAVSPGSTDLPAERFWNPNNRAFAEANGGKADVLPCVTMKTADNKILMGWLASQTDMLSDDWVIVE